MITFDDIHTIETDLVEEWGEAGKRVVENAFLEHTIMPMDLFMNHCTACGGNWVQMMLSGMKNLFPKTYSAIPKNMGNKAWGLVCNTLVLCGVYCEDES